MSRAATLRADARRKEQSRREIAQLRAKEPASPFLQWIDYVTKLITAHYTIDPDEICGFWLAGKRAKQLQRALRRRRPGQAIKVRLGIKSKPLRFKY